MLEVLIIVVGVLVLGVLALQVWLLRRTSPGSATDPLAAGLAELQGSLGVGLERIEKRTAEEADRSRRLDADSSRQLREELAAQIGRGHDSAGQAARDLRQELTGGLQAFFTRMLESNDRRLGEIRDEGRGAALAARAELQATLKALQDQLSQRLDGASQSTRQQLAEVTQALTNIGAANEKRMEALRETVDQRLRLLQEDNAGKLEQMRRTVDEKLEGTLERRLGESFKQVSERLEMVHKGLGEMQQLAHGVGDLKKVLTNVKTRGTWGEWQLSNLLEQMLTRDQYDTNVEVRRGSGERVEFAVRFPGRDNDAGAPIWLPIDSKCPQEDYERLVKASEQGDADGVRDAIKGLEARIRQCGRSISEKYIAPPHSTDFAILFVPTEGLYAEVLRTPGLADWLQRECRVLVAGPTTLAAILNSLQMGFRTLAIEKRSSEVWKVLAAVKTEFSKFGEVFEKVKKKLDEASNTIESASVRTRAMSRTLKSVDQLPVPEASAMLGLPGEAVEAKPGGAGTEGQAADEPPDADETHRLPGVRSR